MSKWAERREAYPEKYQSLREHRRREHIRNKARNNEANARCRFKRNCPGAEPWVIEALMLTWRFKRHRRGIGDDFEGLGVS